MDDTERDLVRSSTRRTVESASGGSLRDHLVEDGWFELREAEPQLAVEVLFEEAGRSLVSSSLLDDVVLAELPSIAPEDELVLVLYPAPASGAEPSSTVDEQTGQVHLSGLALAPPAPGGRLVVPVVTATGTGLFTTAAPAAVAIGGLDADSARHAVDADVALDTGELVALEAGAWNRAVAAARRATAHEVVGVAERMLELAVEHVVARHQFGRALGSFQAVQQRLADVYIALSAARAAIRASWMEHDELVAGMAKALASSAHETAARECQQVLGGIGFTWEHPLHRYIKRGYALDLLLGSARLLERQVGERLVASATTPRLPFAIDTADVTSAVEEDPVKFGVTAFVNDKSLSIAEVANRAESFGFESLWLGEHDHLPVASVHPQVEGGVPPDIYKRFPNPFTTLAAAAAVTTNLRLGTSVSLIAEHNPIYLAKEVATLDWLSGGRVELGVGYGWNKLEMANNGIDPKRPRAAFREKLKALKALWTEETAAFAGEYVNFTESWSYPKPIQRPYPPITIGASISPATTCDLIQSADGWMPIRSLQSFEQLAADIATLRAGFAEAGRDPASLQVSLLDPEGAMGGKKSLERFEALLPTAEVLDGWAAIGVDRCIFAIPAHEQAMLDGSIQRLADRLGLAAGVAAAT